MDAVTVEGEEVLRILASGLGLRILKFLARKPGYAADIAERLGTSKQLVSRYIRLLDEGGLVSKIGEVDVRGGRAVLYQAVAGAAAIVFDRRGWVKRSSLELMPEALRKFLSPLVENGELSGLVVVGSPHPHGPFQTAAADGHYGFQLGLLLGRFVRLPSDFAVRLDVDVKAEKLYGENMILLGGPGSNVITAMVNRELPVGFVEGNYWAGIVSRSRTYTNEYTGLVAKIPNPHDERKTVIVLAGLRAVGTKAAVMMLTNNHEKLLAKYNGERVWASVIQGRDLDGDGRVDAVDILESMGTG